MKENTVKSAITDEVVRYVADLARISLRGEEEKIFGSQLSHILGYVEQLKEVDTEGVGPTTHVLPSMKNVFREDIAEPSVSSNEALSNAPDKTSEFFKVPRIIKER
jgi:aspartyl-tRNA(Asn)/glutamyl-tRNA(Gln) amidotransferase subunit C